MLLLLLQRCWLRLQSAVSENSTFEVILGFGLNQFSHNSFGSWDIIQNDKMKKRATAGNAVAYHAFRKYKETCGAGKIDVRFQSVMLACRPDVPARLASSKWWYGCCG